MTGFAVTRHPDIEAAGVVPAGAYELKRHQGWYRVSDWRAEPSDFHLPDFADGVDLDAPPEPAPEPKTEPQPEEERKTPAEPETDEEQA